MSRIRLCAAVVVSSVAVLGLAVAAPAASAATAVGTLDTSFGANGRLMLQFQSDDEANAVARQADGSVVIAGKTYNGSTYPHMALARLTPSGVLDPSFGGSGEVTVPYIGFPGNEVGTNGDVAEAVAVQADGKILVAGSASDGAGDGALAVARYNPDGTPDNGFGPDGTGQVTVQVGAHGYDDVANGIAIQADGSIVLAGSWSGGWAVARLTSAGVLDTTFNAAGPVPGTQAFDLGDPLADNAYTVAIQQLSQFKFGIVIGGSGAHGTGTGAYNEDFALVRLTSAGVFDTSFGGGDGVVTFNAGAKTDAVTSMAIQPDLSIDVAGPGTNAALTVARFGKSGALDTTFGTSGKTQLPVAADDAAPQSGLLLQSDGSILVGGTAKSGGGDVIVARLTPAGALDSTFGSAGTTTTNVGAFGSVDTTSGIVLDGLGRLIAVGSTTPSGGGATAWFATRYLMAAPPTVVTKPAAATSCGTPVSFSVVAGGPTPIQYGWRVQPPGGGAWHDLADTSYISGSTTPTITIQPQTIFANDDGDHLRAVLTNAGGTTYSPSAILHVGTTPVITTNPVDAAPNGDGTVGFTAAASGFPTPTVQWQVKPVGGAFTNIPGATSTSYGFVSDGNEFGNQYRAKFTNFCGSATSTAGKVLHAPTR